MNKREAVPYDDEQAIRYDNRTMDIVTVDGLPPNAAVYIQVRVLTKYYVGPASDPILVNTPEGGMLFYGSPQPSPVLTATEGWPGRVGLGG